ncbi:GNAT family N-acetyltransferase [Macrococcus equipercicus]|uniref:GNAT family N-acetyltransferase n=1 Tax=Macrococcus equipercicus TaxID=69967 RepID=A0A9Q9BWB7_9STAP|nr:GNAT family N-acetyltransferase [Macrococcus equipercicus]KAA1039351.1 GNAT family N-acetyltransferase [Macrococcus equipercicus]UTH13642.1 GNAT family N-acetyltransferase [Macrococcus equipercicus]
MVKVRQAERHDIPAIKKTATMAWHDAYQNIMAANTIVQFLTAAYSDERLEKRLNDSLFLVAEEQGEVIAFANFINGRELYLAAIYVMPGYQRKDVGTALLQEGIKRFDDYTALFVEVASDNQGARNFYHKHGFELVREYEEEIFGEKILTGLLEKRLNLE